MREAGVRETDGKAAPPLPAQTGRLSGGGGRGGAPRPSLARHPLLFSLRGKVRTHKGPRMCAWGDFSKRGSQTGGPWVSTPRSWTDCDATRSHGHMGHWGRPCSGAV